ncbi:cilia- and flagella-associated protein 54-like [Clavelina lepadiformis]|uniref:cilia- and flagella-associated protein 54-like n=1 Tax=Clavelina lepadiformis TaxID=159417 RepID=UPI004042DB60
MASTLTNVALSTIRMPHASYYGDINSNNPVVSAAEKEIKEVLSYFSKSKSSKKNDEASSRGSNWLFDIWNKFEPRLPTNLFYKKLVDVGDYLREHGANDVANRQCYQRYLMTRYQAKAPQGDDVHEYRKIFFDEKQSQDDIILTSKALLGMYMCEYNSIHFRDPNLLALESVAQCLSILHGIRTFMQCLMSYESFFWIVYNCTITIYRICRVLMCSGNSPKALEFLLWAAMCLETSIPLLGVKYLTWRVTLYSAICLAYYDCKAGHHAEAFARRGLSKLQELSELEKLSDSVENPETPFIFRQATAKMASMVFKRSVYETRRKPKGYLRPKMRNNLKEASQLSWPRTLSERLLSEMFEGGAAQFLAILEALSSSNRRTLQNAPASSDAEMVDVTAELFFAGKEIIAGGGGNKSYMASGADHSVLAGVRHDKSLVEMAGEGTDGVTLSSVVRFIKLAFCYEQWSTFNTLLDCALIYIKKSGESLAKESDSEHSGTELCLALLLVMERVARARSQKRGQTLTSTSMIFSAEDHDVTAPPTQANTSGSIRSIQISDDLVNLAETVLYCVNDATFFAPQGLDGDALIDRDMIVDATMLLWQKCKQMFGRLQFGSQTDMTTALQRTGNPGKWLHLLSIVHSAFVWAGIASVDPALMAEVCLRLALALESMASTDAQSSHFGNDIGEGSRLSLYSTAQASPNGQLNSGLHVLKEGLREISMGRSNTATNNAQHVADIMWINKSDQVVDNMMSMSDTLICDLHVEMLVVHHRIALKLVDQSVNTSRKQAVPNTSTIGGSTSRFTSMEATVLTEANVKELVGGSLLSRAIFFMQKADQLPLGDPKIEKLLTQAAATIQKAQKEEKRLFEDSWLRLNNPYHGVDHAHVPPPPILLSRSDTTMTFKPAPFEPDSSQVAWYRIFGRLAAGPNVKVRLNDYFLPGTGEEVPANNDCILRVSGLEANQRYLFAVAAYTSDGKLVGGSVGKTGHSVVASHPLSILTTWGHLAQISYKLGALKLSEQACTVLWDHFVVKPTEPPKEIWTSTSRSDFQLTTHHLSHDIASETSPVLLRHALTSVFVAVDAAVQDGRLYCDQLSDSGPLLPGQIARLLECERLLVAMEIAGWLNDASSLLQAVVQCYGLIAPIIQADISSLPVLQVAGCCHSALQEISNVLKQKRSTAVTESLHHMIAVLTNYIAKFSKAHGKSQVALSTIDNGKQLLRADQGSGGGGEVPEEPPSTSLKRNNKSRKVPPPVEVISNLELAALEGRLAELARENRAADELTGSEDPSQVLARLSKMKPIVAYRELGKFRRRTRFLEFFVFVLRKALRLHQIDLGIEWSNEVLSHLHKRNDVLSINNTLVSKQPGGVAVRGEEARKYAAAVAEYSKDPKKNKKNAAIKSKQKEKQKKFLRRKSGAIASNEEQEEREKRALFTLEKNLLNFYRNGLKRKRLKKITTEEMTWRAEFNHLVGLLHYNVFLGKIKGRNQLRGAKVPTSGMFYSLDQEWWSYETSGTLVVGWNDGTRQTGDPNTSDGQDDHIRALEKAAYLAVTTSLVAEPIPPPVHRTPDELGTKGFETPRTQHTNSPISIMSMHTVDPEVAAVQSPAIMDTLKVSMLSFQRALVLAHRGKHWSLLQNVARSLYSCLMVMLQCTSDEGESVFNVNQLRSLVWKAVSTAADLLMDMVLESQEKSTSDEWPVQSVTGDATDVKGGSSLKFEEHLDDSTSIDPILIKKIAFQAIQLLHFETRWEQLIDLCLRFSAISHDRYLDAVAPVLIHAQSKINARISSYDGENHPQRHFIEAATQINKKKVSNRDYLKYMLKVGVNSNASSPVAVGGFIDPASHDVYGGGKRALALSSVPFDPDHSMEQLRVAVSKSQYISRALQHSRRLFVIYLASQHNTVIRSRKASAKLGSSSSVVEFTMNQGEPQSTAPPDITNFDFTSTSVLETVASSQLSTVIQSYNRTIELLESHGERELVAQASNEVASLYWHQGNVKASHKWWTHALDQIFRVKDSLEHWKKTIKDTDNIPAELLSKCGIWGCLLAISLSCRIGEFTASDVATKKNCALLGAELVRAIFRSSLPHPTADFDYASYEIMPSNAEPSLQTGSSRLKGKDLSKHVQAYSLLDGIELFSDRFRCDLQTMVASLHWLSDTLVSFKYSLQALPALAFYQYLATFLCRDVQRSVQCRCLKLQALIDLRMFKEATSDAICLLYGVRLPHSSDVSYCAPETQPPTVSYDCSKPVDNTENLKAMEVLASKRVSSILASQYGPHLTCEVTLGQARLLLQLADCIPRLPQKPTLHDLQFVSPDVQAELKHRTYNRAPSISLPGPGSRRSSFHMADDVRSNFSAFSAASTSKYVNKLFTNRDRPVGQQLLKGMLLAVAENLASTMTKTFGSSSEELTPSELWLLVHGHCLQSEIQQQRQLSTLSAAHAHSALKVLKDSKLFEEQALHTTRKLRSALRKKSEESKTAGSDHRKPDPYQAMEQNYRRRLNARLWLDCRYRLCQALATQLKGLGKIGDDASESAGILDHSQAQLYCAEGLAEAEACSDVEMQALFLILGSVLDGISSDESKHMLEDATSSLDEETELSSKAVLGLAECTTRLADVLLRTGNMTAAEGLDSYRSAQSVLLLKAMREGATIVHNQAAGDLSCPSLPLQNLCSSHLQLLAHIKLRMAHFLMQAVSNESFGNDQHVVAQLLKQAQQLCSQGGAFDPQLLAEIHLKLGRVQRIRLGTGAVPLSEILDCLRAAVKMSETNAGDFPSLRQAHLEMALLDLENIEIKFSKVTRPSTELDRTVSNFSTKRKFSLPAFAPGTRSYSLDVGVVSQPFDMTQGKSRVANALYAAYHVARGIQTRSSLPGNPQVTSLTFSTDDKSSLPDFVLVDLCSDHAKLPPASVTSDDVTMDPLLNAVRNQASGISWIHVLMYNVLLSRKSKLSNLLTINNLDDVNERQAGSESEGRMTSKEDIQDSTVKTPINSSDIPRRMLALHEYLGRLPPYSAACHLPVFPQEKVFFAAQWYESENSDAVQFLWCIHRPKKTVECSRSQVGAEDLENMTQQVISLQKRTDEFFGRNQPPPKSKQRRRSKTKLVQIDPRLEDDWKHVITQIIDLLSGGQDEPITQLPFEITMTTAQSVVDLFTIGCFFDASHPLYKWMVQLFSTC